MQQNMMSYYLSKAIRHHNRQIHKNAILKGGIRKRNQASHTVKGFRMFDTVEYEDKEYFCIWQKNKRVYGYSNTGWYKGQ